MSQRCGLDIWWGWPDLNLRPIGYEPTALTTELHPHIRAIVNGVYTTSRLRYIISYKRPNANKH